MDPQTAQPGYLKRWSLLALDLILRHPIVWAAMICFYFGFALLCANNQYLTFSFSPLTITGSLLLTISMQIVALSDTYKINVQNFLQSIYDGVKVFIQIVRRDKFIQFVFFIFLFLDCFFSIYKNSAGAKSQVSETLRAFFILANSLTWSYMVMLGGSKFRIFNAFIIKKADSVDDVTFSAIEATCTKAEQKNKVFSFQLNLIFIIFILLKYIVPYLFLFLVPFLPAFLYVAYREIFEGMDKNQKQMQVKRVLGLA